MHAFLPAFQRHLASTHRALRTIQTYGAVIESLSDFLTATHVSTEQPTRTELEAFLARPRQDGRPRAAATRNQELAAIKVFTIFAMRDLGWSADPTEGIGFCREPPHDPADLVTELVSVMMPKASSSWKTGKKWVRALDVALW